MKSVGGSWKRDNSVQPLLTVERPTTAPSNLLRRRGENTDESEIRQFVSTLQRISNAEEEKAKVQKKQFQLALEANGLSIIEFNRNSLDLRARRAKLGLISPLNNNASAKKRQSYMLAQAAQQLEQQASRDSMLSTSLINLSKLNNRNDLDFHRKRHSSEPDISQMKKKLKKIPNLKLEDYEHDFLHFKLPDSDGATEREAPEKNFDRHSSDIKTILSMFKAASDKFKDSVNFQVPVLKKPSNKVISMQVLDAPSAWETETRDEDGIVPAIQRPDHIPTYHVGPSSRVRMWTPTEPRKL
jgi:hypothetical protein